MKKDDWDLLIYQNIEKLNLKELDFTMVLGILQLSNMKY